MGGVDMVIGVRMWSLSKVLLRQTEGDLNWMSIGNEGERRNVFILSRDACVGDCMLSRVLAVNRRLLLHVASISMRE